MRVKFNEENGVILISERELVKTARRGICASLPLDEHEVKSERASLYTKKAIKLSADALTLRERAEIDAYTLEIISNADGVCENEITKIFEGDINVKRPRREQKAEARGEAFIFGYIYAKQYGYSSLTVNTVYVNENSGEFHKNTENVSFPALERFFDKCIRETAIFARPEIERVTIRKPSMKSLKFPYKTIRDAQKEFIETAHKTLVRGGTLFATAPTGTGKTVSALYPAVRAIGEGKITKAFYLTPKTTTAAVAKECIELFCKQKVTIKAIIITAKDKICINNGVCRENRTQCEYIKCNNLAKAVMELYDTEIAVVTEKDVRNVSLRHGICPYELSLAYSELCDVVICDFNYLFDKNVYIRRFFDDGGEYAFLIDEAHNLPDRAREMYSSVLSERDIGSPLSNPVISEHSPFKNATRVATKEFYEALYPYVQDDIYTNERGQKEGFAHLKDIPVRLHACIEKLIVACEDAMQDAFMQKDTEKDDRLRIIRDYTFKVKNFYSSLCRFSSSYELFIFYEEGKMRAKIFCIDTGEDIMARLRKGRAAIFFSATLSPLYYYKSVLGSDSTADILSLPSSFDSSQLCVSIMDKISTRYSEREDTLDAISKVIAAAVSARRGNYMVFCPSFEYTERLAKLFCQKYPKIRIISQRRNMSKKEKEDFLLEFTKASPSYLIGFCVMGGIYSEGVDLAGDSLIGAIIVGIGLPSLSYEREAIQSYYDEKYEQGKQFAYLYPGLNRVLQAAGRVIRREDDRGIVVLIDDRFADPLYKKAIPDLWSEMKFISSPHELNERIKSFWFEAAK